MIDDYPECFAKFMTQREKAKRLRREADAALKQSDSLLFECFKYFDDEPYYNIE